MHEATSLRAELDKLRAAGAEEEQPTADEAADAAFAELYALRTAVWAFAQQFHDYKNNGPADIGASYEDMLTEAGVRSANAKYLLDMAPPPGVKV